MNLKVCLRNLLLLSALLLTGLQLSAQGIAVSGVVYEPDGRTPMIGASVSVKGTAVGMVTDANGSYRLNAPNSSAVLVYQSLGYETQELTVGNRTTINVTMRESATKIDDVVVTALGLTREEKSLGYAVTKLDGDALTAASGNWLNSLSGKVAGLNFDQASSGPGGTVRVTLRGEGSLSHDNNEALFVIDGIPVNSPKISTGGGSYSNADAPVDFGNNIGDLNPDDIESMSVLKGPSATALYGSRAANGAIVITTKRGRATRGIGVTVNSQVVFERAGFWPDFQNEYGAGNGMSTTNDGLQQYYYAMWNVNSGITTDGGSTVGRRQSRYAFGPRYEGQMFYQYKSLNWETGLLTAKPWEAVDWYKGFFETGVTYKNSVAIDGGGKDGSFRLSVTDMRNNWVVPNNGYNSQNVNFSFNNKLNDYIKVNGKVTYLTRNSDNQSPTGYNNQSPLYALIWGVTSVGIDEYYDEYHSGRLYQLKRDIANGTNTVSQTAFTPANKTINNNSSENPYWTAYENINTLDRDRIYGNLQVDAQILPELSLMLRSGADVTNDFRTSRRPWYSFGWNDGWYREQTTTAYELTHDFLLSYNNSFWDQLNLTASFGGSSITNEYRSTTATAEKLKSEGVYMIINSVDNKNPTVRKTKKTINSFYGMIQLAWRDMVFVDITGRNDWSSSLGRGNWSFFYPSVSASVLFDEIFDFRENVQWINMLKLRASWANVGNDTEPYAIHQAYTNGSFPSSYELPSTMANPNIKPENIESYELGLEMKMFQNRWTFDFAWYYNNTTNQIIPVPLDYMTGARYQLINAGLVRNQGIEISTRIQPIRTKNVTWNINLNWSKNWNKLVELAPGVDLWQLNTSHTIGSRVYIYARPGTELGRIFGFGYERAPEGAYYLDSNGKKVDCSGQVIVDSSTGNPVVNKTDLQDFGSIYPDWKAGMSHSVTYKNFTFNATFSAQWGGRAYSVTNFGLGYQGKLKNSLAGRYEGLIHSGVNLNSDGTYEKNNTITKDIVDYYVNYVWQRDNVEMNTFDTSFLKFKEARLDYSLSNKVMDKIKFMQGISIGVFATNIFCWTNFPQYDPEVAAMSGGSINRGVEIGAYPMTRTYGVNLKLTF